jgi:hypothetical protein
MTPPFYIDGAGTRSLKEWRFEIADLLKRRFLNRRSLIMNAPMALNDRKAVHFAV